MTRYGAPVKDPPRADSLSSAKAADTPVESGTTPVEAAPLTEVTTPARRSVVSRGSAVVGALVLTATSGIALISPIASIWLVLLVIAAVMVGLLPPGHRGRDVAIGAGFGLAAVYLGVISESHYYYSQMGFSLLGAGDVFIWWAAPAGGVLVLAAVMYEATSGARGAWKPLDRALAFLVLIEIIANLYFPMAVAEGPGESQLWMATVVLADHARTSEADVPT
jgi:hypothetical protein